MADELVLHAVLWELAIVGEAANRLSAELCQAHPEVPWRKIIDQRNIILHVYDEIDLKLLWRAVEAIPALLRDVERILDELGEP